VHGITQVFGHMKLVENVLAVGFRQVMYGSHRSITTARMPLICSSVKIRQKHPGCAFAIFGHV
jgi:hypothetical protein